MLLSFHVPLVWLLSFVWGLFSCWVCLLRLGNILLLCFLWLFVSSSFAIPSHFFLLSLSSIRFLGFYCVCVCVCVCFLDCICHFVVAVCIKTWTVGPYTWFIVQHLIHYTRRSPCKDVVPMFSLSFRRMKSKSKYFVVYSMNLTMF